MEVVYIDDYWDKDFYRDEIIEIEKHVHYLYNLYDLVREGEVTELIAVSRRSKVEEINDFISRYCMHVEKDYTLREPWTMNGISVSIAYLSEMKIKMREIVDEGPVLDVVFSKKV